MLDLDTGALAAEIARGFGELDVNFHDKASWLTMQRLAAHTDCYPDQAHRPGVVDVVSAATSLAPSR